MKQLLFILIFISIALTSYAVDRSNFYVYGSQYRGAAKILPSESKDSLDILVIFESTYESLQFKKDFESNDNIYYAESEVSIAFRDSNGVVKKRKLWKDTLETTSFDETYLKNKFAEGAVIATLPKSTYTVDIVFDSKSNYRNNEYTLQLPTLTKFSFKNSEYTLLSSENITNKKFIAPYLTYNNIQYNPDGAILNIVTAIDNPKSQYIFTCYREDLDKDNGDDNSYYRDDIYFEGELDLEYCTGYDLSRDRGNVLLEKNNLTSCDSLISMSLLFPSQKMETGKYKIDVYSKDKIDTLSFEFEVTWPNMPRSLTKIDGAIEYMYYILDDSKYEEMKDARREKKLNLFNEFWKSMDPTPSTPYNEAKVQYFERVDYSFFNYKTLLELDGAKTDRGKIHILYGAPYKVDEEFRDDESVLIWQYPNLEKIFEFTAVSTGVYKLTNIIEGNQ
ncbi:MAG: hypothetical protein Kapaf2KO_05870 [Candidatus Kapaibacteriales bacterium]